VAREGPRRSRGRQRPWYLSLILRLKLNTGEISAVRTRVATRRVRSKELEGEEGSEEGGNCDRKEGNWSGKRAPLIVAFSDNSRHFSHRRRFLSNPRFFRRNASGFG